MQDNSFGATQTPTPTPAPGPAPAPTPMPNPSAAPIAPAGVPEPKKSKAPIIALIATIVIIAVVAVVLIIVLTNNKSDSSDNSGNKDNTSKDKGSEGGSSDKGGSGTGSDNGGSQGGGTSTTGKGPKVTFNGITFTVGSTYGENVRALAGKGIFYEEKNTFEYTKFTENIDSYLAKTYTFSMEDDSQELPKLYFTFKEDNDLMGPHIQISSWYMSLTSKDNTTTFDKLHTYVTLYCDEHEKLSIDGHDLECNKSGINDLKAAFPAGKADDYGDFKYEANGFEYEFSIYEDELYSLMIDAVGE